MKTILVADDNHANRELSCAILQRHGYRVISAADGTEALQRTRSDSPDLLLLDLHMPGMDGFGVVEQVRREPSLAHLPAVAVTAAAMAGDEQRALKAGFTAYLAKPYEIDDVLRVVKRLLNQD